MKYRRRSKSNAAISAAIGLCLTGLLVAGTAMAQQPEGAAPVVERYAMNLGGPSGQYTDWQRSGLQGLVGVRATIEIQKTHGRPRDKWNAVARVNLSGPGQDGGDVPRLSVIFHADRRSGEVIAVVEPVGSEEGLKLDFASEVGRPIALEIRLLPDDALSLRLDQSDFTVELPRGFRIDTVRTLGSGVDVRFDPFELLMRD